MKIQAIRTTLVDVPLARPIVSRIRVSDTMTDDLETLAAEAAELVGQGFRAVKMRLGRPGEADDLAAELRTPLATGENAYTHFGFRELIEARAVDVMMPDLERIGGVTGWMRTAALADAWRLPLASHLFPEQSVHLLAASPTPYYLEHMPWAQPLLAEKLHLVDGRVALPTRPGLGLVWDPDAVTRWTVK